MAVSGCAHLRCIGIKNSLIVCLVILRKNLVQLRVRLVSIHFACLFRHLDAAVRHERALERLIRLQAYDLLQILHTLVDVAGAVSCQSGDNIGLLVQHSALISFLFLQLLQPSPEFIRSLCRTREETFIPVIRGIIILNEVSDVAFPFPDATFKAFISFVL